MIFIQFNDDATLRRTDEGHIFIESSSKRVQYKQISSTIAACFEQFVQGVEKEKLENKILEEDGYHGMALLNFYLESLISHAFISFNMVFEDRTLMTLLPFTRHFPRSPFPKSASHRFQLSKFCHARRDNESIIVETPLSSSRIVLKEKEAILLFYALSKPSSLEDLSKDFPLEIVSGCLELFYNAQIVSFCDTDVSEEDRDPILMQWEFHDLLFHTRSRMGRHQNEYGGSYPFKGKIAPLPICKPSEGQEIHLYRPDLEALSKNDVPFSRVLEKRESLREYGSGSISLKTLGEFLFRAARMKQPISQGEQEISKRPSPAAGAIHELEIYPLIHTCEGIAPGLYHYHPLLHVLTQVDAEEKGKQQMLEDAAHSARLSTHPPLLFVIAARFPRISWKYRSLAYAATLKNVGVLFQTMYLVATAMDLAPCAIGGGNSDLFSQIIGSNYYEETSVGEFILGPKR